jgi:hypothetical protein
MKKLTDEQWTLLCLIICTIAIAISGTLFLSSLKP